MSIKRRLAHLHDRTRLALMGRNRANRISLVPVFHVEKLYNDAYHEALCSFLKGYRDMTERFCKAGFSFHEPEACVAGSTP